MTDLTVSSDGGNSVECRVVRWDGVGYERHDRHPRIRAPETAGRPTRQCHAGRVARRLGLWRVVEMSFAYEVADANAQIARSGALRHGLLVISGGFGAVRHAAQRG